MKPALKHTHDFMSLVAAYASAKACQTEEVFYAKLGSTLLLAGVSTRGALIAFGD